jgi:hypothetical protein
MPRRDRRVAVTKQVEAAEARGAGCAQGMHVMQGWTGAKDDDGMDYRVVTAKLTPR